MSELPDEITEEILVRLPASSLLRFNLVCKHWQSLISNPNFVTKHLNRVLLLDLDDHQSNNYNHHKFIVKSATSHLHLVDCESLNATKLDFPSHFPPQRLLIMGSCNGLLCITLLNSVNSFDNILLWNPLLIDYNKLPESTSSIQEVSSISGGSLHMIGFGYDSSIDDYKVVRVISNCRSDIPVGHKVEIYTRNTNSWKRIQDFIPYGMLHLPFSIGGTLVNGSLYWAYVDFDYGNYYEEVGDNIIIGFDLIDEKFRSVEFPRDDDMKPMSGVRLVEVRGCLGFYKIQHHIRDIDVWILKEDENKNGFWSRLMKIQYEYGMLSKPVCFMKNDEVLLSISELGCNGDTNLVVYNPANMTFRNLPACGASTLSQEIIYVETLVSPHGDGWRLKR
ncbi:hypothetical protein LguiA_001158 [Lonicera macranthoides]